ncbi:hypothetical protein [Vibrio sagamiensis]|uniref:Lipoprotein n=1 Tax=Vibrio sagamiensis NBRC 104589 TaxID=1219064 RepID=A0A511QK32_9VIBR|nr:hypothetical protein [Vibrio sagamiensis]GEM77683.1 hypothetical protein VSA01S_37950 [Vibrio sagamiensis NBRC 104589]
MKLATTLLATLIFSSTGAIANTTKLNEQDKLLIEKAANLNITRCVDRQLNELEENPERLLIMADTFRSTLPKVYDIYFRLNLDFGHDFDYRQPTVLETTIMLVANCLPHKK